MYLVYMNYGSDTKQYLHLVRCPDGSGKIFNYSELKRFLNGKQWRKVR